MDVGDGWWWQAEEVRYNNWYEINKPNRERTIQHWRASSSSEMWGFYFCLPFLFFDVSLAKSSESIPAILLPSQIGLDDSRAFDSRSSHVCSSPDPNLNYKPVIGILTHPGDGRWDARRHSLRYATNISYIAASYVKLAETGGARVIPLIYNEPEELLFQVTMIYTWTWLH